MLSIRLKNALHTGVKANKTTSKVSTQKSVSAPSTRSALSVRRISSSSKPSYASASGKEEGEKNRKNLSMEFHRQSTRYTNTTRDLLKIFSAQNALPHREPKNVSDQIAWKAVRFLRVASDMYFKEELVYRAMMLETVAAVPGMVAGMVHHLRSLRKMNNDNWINILLEEAQNERAHLFAWLEFLRPNFSQRLLIMAVQGVFFTGFLGAYIVAPKTCHRFVGYLEEEAYKTYTHLLNQIDAGRIKDDPAPQIALDYWGLPEGATLRDMTVVIREDEADHCRVNHTMANTLVKNSRRDVAYEEINIDEAFYYNLPGTKVDSKGQVQATTSSKPSQKADHGL